MNPHDSLTDFIETNSPVLVLTGAGCSAPSGIPTYRNDNAVWQRTEPINHTDFLTSEHSRKRYWSRSFAGWPAVRDASPNAAHASLAMLERHGLISTLVTQNVDGLHQRAGSTRVTDLHGRLDRVICLGCRAVTPRETMQRRLDAANNNLQEQPSRLTPDGDANIDETNIGRLVVPTCTNCEGILKPDVVFFGGSVAREIVERINLMIDQAGGLLIVGSSLMVFSSFRFCRRAAEIAKPIAILNRGVTRADELANLKLDHPCESILPATTASLTGEKLP